MNAPANLETFEPINTIDIEQIIIGTLMVRNDLWPKCAGALTPDDFSEFLHQQLYEVIGKLTERGQPATPAVLKSHFGDQELDGGIRLSAYLARLCASSFDPYQFDHYVRALQDGAGRRQIDALIDDFVRQGGARDINVSASELASDLLEELKQVMSRGTESAKRRTAVDSAGALMVNIQKIRNNEVQQATSTTGISDVDSATGGYESGTLWVVGARPGMGKTAWAVASAHRVAKSGDGALLFSLEVPETQMTARLLADMAYNRNRPLAFGTIYRAKDLDDEDIWVLEDALKRLDGLPLVLDYPDRPTLTQIAARVRAERENLAKEGKRLGVVFIDYLKFVRASDRYRGQRHYEVGEISAGLKSLAREEDVCVVLLVQLNRANEGREDKRPVLSDLRESGDLEADADVVAFIHRDAYYIEKSPEYRDGDEAATSEFVDAKNRADMILGKNRSGPTKTINLWCDVASSTFAAQERFG